MDALTVQDTRSRTLNTALLFGFDRLTAVEGITHRVDDAADEFRADWHFQHFTGQANASSSLHIDVFTEEHRADFVGCQVEGERRNLLAVDAKTST
jgi:hypothetical protein